MNSISAIRRAVLFCAVLLLVPLAGCEADSEEPGPVMGDPVVEAEEVGSSVYDVVSRDPQLSTFAGLLERVAPELREAEGEYTIFAPTNEAFERIDQASLGSWLAEDNDELLRTIVDHHVVQGEYTAADLSSSTVISTRTNEPLDVDQADAANLEVNGAAVIEADRDASNGVVHIIDSVMDPAVQYILRDTQ